MLCITVKVCTKIVEPSFFEWRWPSMAVMVSLLELSHVIGLQYTCHRFTTTVLGNAPQMVRKFPQIYLFQCRGKTWKIQFWQEKTTENELSPRWRQFLTSRSPVLQATKNFVVLGFNESKMVLTDYLSHWWLGWGWEIRTLAYMFISYHLFFHSMYIL